MSGEKEPTPKHTDTKDGPVKPGKPDRAGPAVTEPDLELLTADDRSSVDLESAAQLAEVAEPSPDELEEIEEETIDTERQVPLESTDDPVRMYLREIGRVPLLEAHQEVWLSTQREAAAYVERLQTRLSGPDGQPPRRGRDLGRRVEFAPRVLVSRG